MPVSASKLVTLAQLQAQAERVKQELAKYTLASELGSLAKKSEISEADLSAALKSVIDGKMDTADSMTRQSTVPSPPPLQSLLMHASRKLRRFLPTMRRRIMCCIW